MGGDEHLNAEIGQLAQKQRDMSEKAGIEIRFRLIPEKGGSFVDAPVVVEIYDQRMIKIGRAS